MMESHEFYHRWYHLAHDDMHFDVDQHACHIVCFTYPLHNLALFQMSQLIGYLSTHACCAHIVCVVVTWCNLITTLLPCHHVLCFIFHVNLGIKHGVSPTKNKHLYITPTHMEPVHKQTGNTFVVLTRNKRKQDSYIWHVHPTTPALSLQQLGLLMQRHHHQHPHPLIHQQELLLLLQLLLQEQQLCCLMRQQH